MSLLYYSKRGPNGLRMNYAGGWGLGAYCTITIPSPTNNCRVRPGQFIVYCTTHWASDTVSIDGPDEFQSRVSIFFKPLQSSPQPLRTVANYTVQFIRSGGSLKERGRTTLFF